MSINHVIQNKKIYRLESVWRKTKHDETKDINENLFPYPVEGKGWSGSEQFINRLSDIQKYLDQKYIDNKIKKISLCKDCKLCDEKCVITKMYKLNGYGWEDGLIHYILKHNVMPSEEFIEMIFKTNIIPKNEKLLKLNGRTKVKEHMQYVKLDANQVMILDALMKHGGYNKKYYDDKNKNVYRYSEHSGLLDVHEHGLEKVIVSGNTSRIDRGDEEIYLPNDLPEMYDYEYMFHTHPPTPKPGVRAKEGILYEFPSTGDLFHFIDHFNEGNTIGSLVMTPEGLYNIRKTQIDKNKIDIDENKFYSDVKKSFRETQKRALKKYGYHFSVYEFYSKIAQDISFISNINITLNKYNLTIDFFPRKKDNKGSWNVTSIYLRIYQK